MIGPNDLLAFLLELAALALWGLWAFRLPRQPVWRWPAALLAVAVAAALWALFFSRTAAHRLPMPWLAAGKLLMLLPPGLLFFGGRSLLGLLWAGLVMLHLAWGLAQGEL